MSFYTECASIACRIKRPVDSEVVSLNTVAEVVLADVVVVMLILRAVRFRLTSAIGPSCDQAISVSTTACTSHLISLGAISRPSTSTSLAGSMNAMWRYRVAVNDSHGFAQRPEPRAPSSLPMASQSGRMWLGEHERASLADDLHEGLPVDHLYTCNLFGLLHITPQLLDDAASADANGRMSRKRARKSPQARRGERVAEVEKMDFNAGQQCRRMWGWDPN